MVSAPSPSRIYLHRSKDFIQIPTDSQAVIAQPVRVCASLHKYADHHLLTSVTCAQTELALICRNLSALVFCGRHQSGSEVTGVGHRVCLVRDIV